jgi:phage terminase large subunit-like protein
VPRDRVRARVEQAKGAYRVVRFSCDPPLWRDQIDTWAEEFGDGPDGKPIVREFITARANDMGPAIDRMLEAIAEGRFTHDGSPELREYAVNAVLARASGRSDQPALIKEKEHLKIDGFVAATFGFDELVDLPVATSKPDPDFIVV